MPGSTALSLCHLLNLAVNIFVAESQECGGGQYIIRPTSEGQRLDGSVFMSVNMCGYNACFDECIRRPLCKSYNYKKDEFLCELNSETATNEADLLVNTKFVFTSVDGMRKTMYDPCRYVTGCDPGMVCVKNDSRICIPDEQNPYQAPATTTASKTTYNDANVSVTNDPVAITMEVTSPEDNSTLKTNQAAEPVSTAVSLVEPKVSVSSHTEPTSTDDLSTTTEFF